MGVPFPPTGDEGGVGAPGTHLLSPRRTDTPLDVFHVTATINTALGTAEAEVSRVCIGETETVASAPSVQTVDVAGVILKIIAS